MDIEKQKRLAEAQTSLMSTHSSRRTTIRKETLDAIGKHFEAINKALELTYMRALGSITSDDPVIKTYRESYVRVRCELQQDANHAAATGVISVGGKLVSNGPREALG